MTGAAGAAVLLLLAATPLSGQEVAVWVDAGGTYAEPPAGVVGDPAFYGLFGLRLDAGFDAGRVMLQGSAGQGEDAAAGRWFQGGASLLTGRRAGPASVRLAASAIGLRYLDPFEYAAAVLDLRPAAAVGRSGWTLTALPQLRVGRWGAEAVSGELLVVGGEAELSRRFGPVTLQAGGGGLHGSNGVLQGAFVRGTAGIGYVRRGARLDVWMEGQRSPLETELGGGLSALYWLTDRFLVRLNAGHSVRDPLYGTPGSTTVTLGASWRPVRAARAPPAPVAAVGEAEAEGRVVRFAIRAPDASTVALVGDFTGWEPVPMRRSADRWELALTLGAGVHHFGFLVDGEWLIPAGSPGVVDDGWGRRNASIVIEP